jgi:hypothetical protein
MRARLPSQRDDPRREPSSPRLEPTVEEHMRRVVEQLATAGVQFANALPKIQTDIRRIADAVTAPAGFHREKSDSRLELEREVSELRASIVQEARQGESVRAQARTAQKIGEFLVRSAQRSWQVALGVTVTALVVALGAFIMRDCVPAIQRAPSSVQTGR